MITLSSLRSTPYTPTRTPLHHTHTLGRFAQPTPLVPLSLSMCVTNTVSTIAHICSCQASNLSCDNSYSTAAQSSAHSSLSSTHSRRIHQHTSRQVTYQAPTNQHSLQRTDQRNGSPHQLINSHQLLSQGGHVPTGMFSLNCKNSVAETTTPSEFE